VSRSSARLSQGFTLVEVLVVLVLVSMLSVLLIDGISQVLQIQVRLSERGASMQQQSLEQSWFRRVLHGTIADKEYPFEIKRDRLSGLTLEPLLGQPGVPTPFALSLRVSDGAIALQYSESAYDPVDLAVWDAGGATESFAFSVVQNDGNLGDRWPSRASDDEQLPRGVGLRIPHSEGEQWWQVVLPGRREPKLLVTEDMGF